jgi:hypothetical protein
MRVDLQLLGTDTPEWAGLNLKCHLGACVLNLTGPQYESQKSRPVLIYPVTSRLSPSRALSYSGGKAILAFIDIFIRHNNYVTCRSIAK